MSARAVEAARAALAAAEGGDAVATALLVAVEPPDALPLGARLLLTEAGEHRGTLGALSLDAAAIRLAREALAGAGAAAHELSLDGVRATVYVEAQRPPDELFVVGAGHIAVPLARLGAMLGFRVTVLDDREEFATEARFPSAARVLRTDFANPFRGVRLGARSYVVLVTRAHSYDFDCLSRLIAAEPQPRYVGMIGSRRRVRAAFGALLDAGVPRERLARVSAPVGLDIGAETPEEIAVSIAAELVQVRRGGGAAGTMGARERVLERLLPEAGG